MSAIRSPAVAGLFYSDQPAPLRETLADLLTEARPAEPASRLPKALIVPHAGYIYSGAVAARAYALLECDRSRIRRVVLLGPAHRVYVRGLALPEVEAFATPLGEVALDREGVRQLRKLPQVTRSDLAHQMEHSLEVQLPFLQQVLESFTLLPLVVGDATAAEVTEVLETVWGGDETLILISSDLSHFLSDSAARQLDGETIRTILAGDARLTHEQACGATPINGFLLAARRHGLQPVQLDVRNSSAATGDRARVVGYASFAFFPMQDDEQADADQGTTLLRLARNEIGGKLGLPVAEAEVATDWLQQPGATFVTLTARGQLRGCVGTLEAHRPLVRDVQENALAAAFRDPRFEPLSRVEFDEVRVEVSQVFPSERLWVASEAEALAQLRPGIDGVTFEYRHARSTFLPQVWEQMSGPAEFLAQLKRKAGLPMDFWADEVKLSRYGVRKWKEDRR